MSYNSHFPDSVYLSEAEIEKRKRWREAQRRETSQRVQYNILGLGSPGRVDNGGYKAPLYNSSEPPVPQYQNYPQSNYPNYNDRPSYSPSRDIRRPSNLYNEPISSYPIDNYGVSSLPSNYGNNNNNPMYEDNRGYSSLNRPSIGSPYSRNSMNPTPTSYSRPVPPPPLSPNRFSPLQNDIPPSNPPVSTNQQQLQQQQQPLGSARSGQTPTSFTRYRIDRLRPEEREALLEKQQKQKQLADVLKQQMEEKQRKKEEEKRRKIEEDRLYNLEMERQAEEERLKAEQEKKMQEMKEQEIKRQFNIPQQQQQQQLNDDDLFGNNNNNNRIDNSFPIQPQSPVNDKPNISFNQDINQYQQQPQNNNNLSFSPSRRSLDYIPQQQQPQQQQQPLQYQNDLYPPPQVYHSPPQQQQQQQQQAALAAGIIPSQPPQQQLGIPNNALGVGGAAPPPGYYINPMIYPNSFLYPAQMILDSNKIHEELKQKESHEKEIMELVKRQTELIMQLQKKTEMEVKKYSSPPSYEDENPKNLSDSYIPNIIQQQQQQQSFSPKRSYHQSELPSELFKTPPETPFILNNNNTQSFKQQQPIIEEEQGINDEQPINPNIVLPPPNYNDNNNFNNSNNRIFRPQSPILSPKGRNNQTLQSYSTVIQTTDSPALFNSSRPPTSSKFEQSLSNFSELKPVTPSKDLRTRTLQQQQLQLQRLQQQQQQHLIPIEEQSLAGESKFNPSETSVGESSLIGNSEFQSLIEEAEELYNRTKRNNGTTNKISPIQSTIPPSSSSPFQFKSSPSKTSVLTPNTLRENGKTLLSPPRIYDNKSDNKDNDDDDSDSDFSSDFEDIDPVSKTLTFKMPKVKSPNSSTIKINTLKAEEKVKICTEQSHSFLSPHPNKPKTPQNDSPSQNYFKTMDDKMTISGGYRNTPRRPNSIL